MDTWRPEEIGATAGKVWNFLHKSGESSLTAVERGVGAPKQLVCMAIGWLANSSASGCSRAVSEGQAAKQALSALTMYGP